MAFLRRAASGLVVSWWLAACSAEPPATAPEEHEDEPVATTSAALVSYDCNEWSDTGYSNGKPFSIKLVKVDGDPVERDTANAFLTLAQAAEGAGVKLTINSGFRSMAEQQYLYNCYINQNCNNGNKAAPPGYSNHQSGHAIDIGTSDGYKWLFGHAPSFGWSNTVAGEPWHWEWWGGGQVKSFCPSCFDHCQGNVLTRADCSTTDCAAQDATCKHDEGGLRCEPNCHNRCEGNVLARDNCSKTDCGGAAVCREEGGLRCDDRPRGALDSGDASSLRGWAHDPSAADTAIDVHFWIGGPAGSPGATSLATTAGRHRPDLCTAISSCNHGFVRRTPRSLLDGNPHPIHAYGIDATGGENAELAESPLTLQELPPAIPPGTILRRIASPAVFAAWNFSAFEDVAPLPDASAKTGDLMTAHEGPSFPTTPQPVAPDDGSSGVWILDAGVRRRVPDATAWRLGAPATIDAVKLFQIPRGRDFPASPELVRGIGPVDYVLDQPFQPSDPSEGSTDGDQGAEEHPGTSHQGGSGGTLGASADAGTSAGSGCAAAPRTRTSGDPSAVTLALLALGARRSRRSRR